MHSGSGRTGSRAPWGKKGWKAESVPNSPLPGQKQLESEMRGLFHRAPKAGESQRAAWEVLHPQGTHSRLPTACNASRDVQSRGGLLQVWQKPLTHGAQPLWVNTILSIPQPEQTRQTTLTPVKPPSAWQPGISLKGCPASFPSAQLTRWGTQDPNPATPSHHEGCGH